MWAVREEEKMGSTSNYWEEEGAPKSRASSISLNCQEGRKKEKKKKERRIFYLDIAGEEGKKQRNFDI